MKMLSVDSSSKYASVALLKDETVLANYTINSGLTHSQKLMPLIDRLLSDLSLSILDVDLFSCNVGPGSFTGLRIGIALLNGLAMPLNKPIVGVSALESLAYNIYSPNTLVCPIIDAKNNNIYSSLYKYENRNYELISPYFSDNIAELINYLKVIDEPIVFVGDGAYIHKDLLEENLKNISISPLYLSNVNAASVGAAAFKKYNGESEFNEIVPIYLKKSSAERLLDEKQKNIN